MNTVLTRRVVTLAAVAAVTLMAWPLAAQQTPARATAAPNCVVPDEYARFDLPLRRTARRLIAGQPITIVAVGSSSTAGAGASSPYNTYPSRLAAELAQEFVDHDITVLNRGVSGDTAPDMLARFDQGVIAEKPDLVLWQVGTNSLLIGQPVAPHRTLLHDGIERLKPTGADIVLIDPQYAPRVIAKPNAEEMVSLLEQTARQESVNIFHRFALMHHWNVVDGMPFRDFLSADELHMNDFSYACIARALSGAISEAATRPIASAAIKSRR